MVPERIATLVISVALPLSSTVITGMLVLSPYTFAVTPEVANLAAAKVPEVIFVALDVSVVADAAKPVTAAAAIAILVFVTEVICPVLVTVNTGT